jgi:hypothetical protein
MVHSEAKYGAHDHKAEFLASGQLGYSEMRTQIERVFAVDTDDLEVMRLDLCADVPGVTVSWFDKYARIRWKRLASDHSNIRRDGIRDLETVTYGARPNCLRIYNKIAEWQTHYRKLARKADAGYGTFEDVFGYSPETTLTRVERQIGGGRIPEAARTFGLLRNLPELNPFEALELTQPATAEPTVEEWGVQAYGFGMFLAARLKEWGRQRLTAWLNKHSDRNGARIMSKYQPFLGSTEVGTDSARLVEIYRDSVSRQLAA